MAKYSKSNIIPEHLSKRVTQIKTETDLLIQKFDHLKQEDQGNAPKQIIEILLNPTSLKEIVKNPEGISNDQKSN